MLGIILVIWVIKYHGQIIGRLKEKISQNYNYTLVLAILIFLLAATISVFTGLDLKTAAGEWKAFYIEPILLFLVLITTIKNQKQFQHIIFALVLSGLLTAILAIYQHFTGWMVPWDFWENRNTFRVTAWYGFPNAIGLFLAPLMPLSLLLINKKDWRTWLLPTTFIPLALLAIIFAKTTGALVALVAGFLILLLFYKKTYWLALLLIIIGILSLIFLPADNVLKQEVL